MTPGEVDGGQLSAAAPGLSEQLHAPLQAAPTPRLKTARTPKAAACPPSHPPERKLTSQHFLPVQEALCGPGSPSTHWGFLQLLSFLRRPSCALRGHIEGEVLREGRDRIRLSGSIRVHVQSQKQIGPPRWSQPPPTQTRTSLDLRDLQASRTPRPRPPPHRAGLWWRYVHGYKARISTGKQIGSP